MADLTFTAAAGVDFPLQTVECTDEGMMNAALVRDGILSGGVTYSGFAVTIAAGMLLIGGRRIRLSSPITFSLSSYTGLARIAAHIDTTETSDRTSCDQVSFSVSYASSIAGFSALDSDDINKGGTDYAAPIAFLNVTSSGVTGIYRICKAVNYGQDEVLWENDDPSASFGEQTVIVPGLSECDRVTIIYREDYREQYDYRFAEFGYLVPGEDTIKVDAMRVDRYSSTWYYYYRKARLTPAAETCSFGNGLEGSSGANTAKSTVMIPIAILGAALRR